MLSRLKYHNKGNIVINNIKYYYKINDAYVELLVEKIADLFGLHHAHYISINVEGVNYYLSEDLNNLGLFITAEDNGILSTNINDIKEFIITNYKQAHDHLMNDIIKMFFMDLMILNIDRSNSNWGFLFKDNDIIIYLLDNDLSFINSNSFMTTLDNNKMKNSLLEIENIFNTFPNEYIDIFNEMFNMLDYDKLVALILETEKEIGKELPYKKAYLERFSLFRYQIEKLKVHKVRKLLNK